MTTKIIADFMENEQGEMMLAIAEIEGEPNSPVISFNKDNSSATITRAPKQEFSLENIHPDIREKLSSLSKILVTEVGKNGVSNGYYAEIKK